LWAIRQAAIRRKTTNIAISSGLRLNEYGGYIQAGVRLAVETFLVSRSRVNAAVGCPITNASQENISTQSREDEYPITKIANMVYVNRAAEMDITMIGLQNAGKTSLLRVLAVSYLS
jgi:hypothetical protein